MRVALISFTRVGEKICEKLKKALSELGMDCSAYTGRKTGSSNPSMTMITTSMSEWTKQQFDTCDGLVFVGATGIAVRLIAPCLKDKLTDPAVVVVDEAGQFSISLLSGHMGGANCLANQIADILHAIPVVTTASDVRKHTAIDVWAADHNFVITDRKLAKEIAAAHLEGETVGFFSDEPDILPDGSGYEAGQLHRLNIWASCRLHPKTDCFPKQKAGASSEEFQSVEGCKNAKFLHLVPKALVLGIGCRRDIKQAAVEAAIRETMKDFQLDLRAVAAVASIDLKKDEEGLIKAAAELTVPFYTYSSKELEAVEGDFTDSGFVRQITGVGNVCERAALCVCGLGGELFVRKQVHNGVTVAVAKMSHDKMQCFEDGA